MLQAPAFQLPQKSKPSLHYFCLRLAWIFTTGTLFYNLIAISFLESSFSYQGLWKYEHLTRSFHIYICILLYIKVSFLMYIYIYVFLLSAFKSKSILSKDACMHFSMYVCQARFRHVRMSSKLVASLADGARAELHCKHYSDACRVDCLRNPLKPKLLIAIPAREAKAECRRDTQKGAILLAAAKNI